MSLARSVKQYLGVRAIMPPDLQYALRDPTSSDKAYVKGTLWLNTASANTFMWPGYGNWIPLGIGTVGPLNSLTPSSGGTVFPVDNNINLLGTANQISTVGSGSTITFSVPSVFIAPGSIASTTSITATLGNITATNGNIVKGTAGNKDIYSSVAVSATAGANSAGSVTLVGGTATIATTAVTANSLIRMSRQGVGSTGANALGYLTIGTKTAGTSFVIRAVSAADATALATNDVSIVFWEIVN